MSASTATSHEFRSTCSIARTLEIVGDKWTLLVVRDLMWHGRTKFHSMETAAEHIPTNILANRLKRLAEWGLVSREAYQEKPVRYEYRLTAAGRSLEPVLLEIMAWGHEHLEGGRYDPKTGESFGPGEG